MGTPPRNRGIFKKFVAKPKGNGRNTSEIKIDDMDLVGSAREHDKLCIASLKRKLERERLCRRKYEARGQILSEDKDIFGDSHEDVSAITELSGKSSTSVRNALKKRSLTT